MFVTYVTYCQTIKMILYTKSNVYYPLLLLFINIMLINGVKSLQIGLHALILNENVLSLPFEKVRLNSRIDHASGVYEEHYA